MASVAFSMKTAVELKFEIVRDVIANGDKERLAGILETIPDYWVSLP